ncbi:MAG TPA: hypothetical protein VLG27_04160 [Candidatus Saccharimonadia bacterium]|nr:hypothetical protein [Candidatus Saccharimonadia bacterium]
MRERKATVLNCFSPPVMIATMVTEASLAVYTIWRYAMTPITRLITLLLVCLATFQLAEYSVCTGLGGLTPENWSRLGFVAIAALPALGLHTLHVLAGKPGRRLLMVNYAMMGAFVLAFLAFPNVFDNYQCTGNYVIFHLRPRFGGIYYLYYFGWLFTAIGLAWKWLRELKEQDHKEQTKRETLKAMIAGYLVFLVPVTVANAVNPSSRAGIPSIMCGFAVLLALVLGFYILPRVGEPKALTKQAK